MVDFVPPPEYNFATIPQVSKRDAFYWRKRNHGAYRPADHYHDIVLPRNSRTGVVIGVSAALCAFGLVWHIWWLAAFGIFTVFLSVIGRSFARDVDRIVPAAKVERTDRQWLDLAAASHAIPRQLEETAENEGLAAWMA